MNENRGGFDRYLKPGLTVSLQGKSQAEVAAVVSSVTEDRISLTLMTTGSEVIFQEGEQVRIEYWKQEGTAYNWTAEVTKILSKQNLIMVSRKTSGEVQRRGFYRVTSPVSFSFTVIEAANAELIGKRIVDHKTQNLSVNGVLFETDLPLKVGDRVGLDFHLRQTVRATGWVVRSERNGPGVHPVAVKFILLEEENQRLLMDFLSVVV